jgi:hypothetical protein
MNICGNSTNAASSIKDTDCFASHAITTCHYIMTEKIDPGIVLCHFDLAGQCLDDTCQLQHIRPIKMLPNSTTEEVGLHLPTFDMEESGFH